jgi:hypothetical protein
LRFENVIVLIKSCVKSLYRIIQLKPAFVICLGEMIRKMLSGKRK